MYLIKTLFSRMWIVLHKLSALEDALMVLLQWIPQMNVTNFVLIKEPVISLPTTGILMVDLMMKVAFRIAVVKIFSMVVWIVHLADEIVQ